MVDGLDEPPTTVGPIPPIPATTQPAAPRRPTRGGMPAVAPAAKDEPPTTVRERRSTGRRHAVGAPHDAPTAPPTLPPRPSTLTPTLPVRPPLDAADPTTSENPAMVLPHDTSLEPQL